MSPAAYLTLGVVLGVLGTVVLAALSYATWQEVQIVRHVRRHPESIKPRFRPLFGIRAKPDQKSASSRPHSGAR